MYLIKWEIVINPYYVFAYLIMIYTIPSCLDSHCMGWMTIPYSVYIYIYVYTIFGPWRGMSMPVHLIWSTMRIICRYIHNYVSIRIGKAFQVKVVVTDSALRCYHQHGSSSHPYSAALGYAWRLAKKSDECKVDHGPLWTVWRMGLRYSILQLLTRFNTSFCVALCVGAKEEGLLRRSWLQDETDMDDTGIKTEIRNGERRDAETEAFVTAMMILFL